MATRYRDLQAPVAVDTSLLDNGDSDAAASLARAFKQFEGVALQPAAQLRAQQGQQEGAAAGASGTPEFRAGLRATTMFGQAYNNAALRSYAVKMEGDADENAARLEVEAQNDPEKFAKLFGAARDETIKEAPAEARAALSEIYGLRLNAGVTRLTQARAIEQNKIARSDTAEGVERAVDRVANLRASDDPAAYLQAEQEQVKLNLLIDGAVNDGTISAAEGVTLHKTSQRALVAQTVSARFRGQLTSPYGNPVDFIEKLKAENIKSEALSPKEEEQLVDQLMSDLSEHNRLMNAKYNEDNALVKARYEAGDREATAAVLGGTGTVGMLRKMVQEQRLDPSRATSLANELQNGGVAADDPKEAFSVRTNLLDISDEDITTNSKLTWKTRTDLILKKREEEQTWKGTQAAQEGKERIERALGIVPGTNRAMLSEGELAALDNAKTNWYSQVDALEPGKRQAEVIRIAEEVSGTYIRKNKAVQAQEIRRRLERWTQSQGDPAKMDEEEKKAFDATVARRTAQIEALEAEAARK